MTNYIKMAFIKITEATSNYDHLEKKDTATILKEINHEDQKVAIAVQKALPAIECLIDKIFPRLIQGGKIYYLGAGTSGRLGILDASEIPPTFGASPDLFTGIIAGGKEAIVRAVEHAEDDTKAGWTALQQYHVTTLDTVIGITASGSTPFVLETLKKAREAGLLTACITSNPETPVSKIAEITIETIVGPEYITGSSRMKSGTAQKMVLNMISSTLMIRSGKVLGNKMVCMNLSNEKLYQRAIHMLEELLDISSEQATRLLGEFKNVQAVLQQYHKD